MTTIDDKNYELWLVRYADDELSNDECRMVEQWLESHPDAAAELDLYITAPRMQRDEMVHYTGAPLNHPTTRTLWTSIFQWGAAAAVVAALMLPIVLQQVREVPSVVEPIVVSQTVNPTAVAVVDSVVSTSLRKDYSAATKVNPVVQMCEVDTEESVSGTTEEEYLVDVDLHNDAELGSANLEKEEVFASADTIKKVESGIVYMSSLICCAEQEDSVLNENGDKEGDWYLTASSSMRFVSRISSATHYYFAINKLIKNIASL